MKTIIALLIGVVTLTVPASAQTAGVPASTNIPGQKYPQILPDNRVVFRVKAPDAQKLQIDLMKKYDMVKDTSGFWTVTTEPVGEGFHYYSLIADGIAISADGERLFYCPLASRRLYSVATAALRDRALSDQETAATVIDEGEKPASDGLESDANNKIYCTAYESNAIVRRNSPDNFETIVHDRRILWADTMSLHADGYLYFTANQLHRQSDYNNGRDLREKPYSLFRVQTNAAPVRLR